MSTPTKTVMTATVATLAATTFVARHAGQGATPYVDRNVMQDVLIAFGLYVLAGAALGGVKEPDSVGRGLLWGAGGIAAAYGIDKVLTKGKP